MPDFFGWRRPRHRVQHVRTLNADALPLEDVDPGHAQAVRARMFQRADRERLFRRLQGELEASGYAKDDPDLNRRIAEMYEELNEINRRRT
jgi:hypothetical protein